MNMKINYFYSKIYGFEYAVRGGEDNNPPSSDPPPVTFTQEQVNKFIADERRKLEEKSNKKITELQESLNKMSFSDTDRKTLEQTIESLRGEKESTEQTLTRQLEETRKDSEKNIKKALEEGQTWRNRFTDSTINNEIISAAVENNAFFPEQVVAFLKGAHRIELREGIGKDNKPNGQFEGWVVGFKDVDGDKKDITIDLRIGDAIKRMRELTTRYGNLFKTEATSGINLTGNVDNDSGPIDFKSPEAYRKNRDKILGRK